MRRSNVLCLQSVLSRATLTVLVLLGFLALARMSHAQTADGVTPAEETVCDGQVGALWGLCVAYCEAMDCDYESPLADEQACDRVLTNYLKKSEGLMPPCDGSASDEGAGSGEETGGGETGGETGGGEGGSSTPPAA